MSDLDLELDEFKVEDELAEFGVEMKEEKIELAEDLEGFASAEKIIKGSFLKRFSSFKNC